jgi:hypothetical protein
MNEIHDQSVTLETLRHDEHVSTYIKAADENLKAIGYTEHGFRHASLVAMIAGNILRGLGHSERETALAEMAGYLHDIGNVIHREYHAFSGAQMVHDIFNRLGMPPVETVRVMQAIANHEEERGVPTTPIGAALIIADKSDVHRTRVHAKTPATFDIYDRVNHATTRSRVFVAEDRKTVTMEMDVDTGIASVMECFETFLSRMAMCRKAADLLGTRFSLVLNGTVLED